MTPSAFALPRRGLYALTPDDAGDIDALVARVLAVVAGGATLVQYRDKSAPAANSNSQSVPCHPKPRFSGLRIACGHP